jgi:methyltransferase (TIGR00027 family)
MSEGLSAELSPPPTSDAGRRYSLADRLHVRWGRSLVAGINAHFRKQESLRAPTDRVLEDPWAARLADDHLVLRALEFLFRNVPFIHEIAWKQITAHVVRHAAVDALVREAVADGFGQVVILGAGYDMRAARIGGARYFEVDRPGVATRKGALLADASLPNVTRVTFDLANGALTPALVAAGWSAEAPTCFVVEGLVHYLERERVGALLDELAAGPRRRVVLTWIEPAMSQRVTSLFRELVRALGEVPRTFFTVDELEGRFATHGLALRAWPYEAQVASFAPAARRRPVGLTQEVGVAR